MSQDSFNVEKWKSALGWKNAHVYALKKMKAILVSQKTYKLSLMDTFFASLLNQIFEFWACGLSFHREYVS